MTKTIIIDPGHGGTDSGATAFGVQEKDWNLEISLYQYERLKALGANVGITRQSDITLNSRPRTDKIKNKYDYCISNHWNAFNGKARGVETIHSIYNDGTFACEIAQAIVKKTALPFRRVFTKKNNQGTDWYFMHRLTGRTQTVIIEYGFLDHAEDFHFYQKKDHRLSTAEAVIEVLCKKLGITYQTAGIKPKVLAEKLYRVQTGAFSKKENAEKQLASLKKAGFPGIIL